MLTLLLLACAPGTTPVDTSVCSSGEQWTGSTGGEGGEGGEGEGGDDEEDGSPTMAPGQDCIACHAGNEGPNFTVAGTVMGALGDLDDCVGVAGVDVIVTGADGVVTTMTSNSVGNFYSTASIATPYTVELRDGSATSSMGAAQTDGDCASCHTSSGSGGAPGRVVAP